MRIIPKKLEKSFLILYLIFLIFLVSAPIYTFAQKQVFCPSINEIKKIKAPLKYLETHPTISILQRTLVCLNYLQKDYKKNTLDKPTFDALANFYNSYLDKLWPLEFDFQKTNIYFDSKIKNFLIELFSNINHHPSTVKLIRIGTNKLQKISGSTLQSGLDGVIFKWPYIGFLLREYHKDELDISFGSRLELKKIVEDKGKLFLNHMNPIVGDIVNFEVAPWGDYFVNIMKEKEGASKILVFHNDKLIGEYDRVDDFKFASTSKKYAFSAEKEGQSLIILNGKELPVNLDGFLKEIGFLFLDNKGEGSRNNYNYFVYLDKEENKFYFNIIDLRTTSEDFFNILKKIGPYDNIVDVKKSEDNQMMVILAKKDSKFIITEVTFSSKDVNIDNKEINKEIYDFIFNPKTKKYIFTYKKEDKYFVNTGMREFGGFDLINIGFSNDKSRKHWWYIVGIQEVGLKKVLYIDDRKVSDKYDEISSPVFSENGRRFGYLAYNNYVNQKWQNKFVIIDGNKMDYSQYDDISDLQFSPNGLYYSLIVQKKGKNYLIINGKIEKYPIEGFYGVIWTKDNKYIYITYSNNQFSVVKNKRKDKNYQVIYPIKIDGSLFKIIQLSPDNKHYVYIAEFSKDCKKWGIPTNDALFADFIKEVEKREPMPYLEVRLEPNKNILPFLFQVRCIDGKKILVVDGKEIGVYDDIYMVSFDQYSKYLFYVFKKGEDYYLKVIYFNS